MSMSWNSSCCINSSHGHEITEVWTFVIFSYSKLKWEALDALRYTYD